MGMFKELKSKNSWKNAFPLIKELIPSLELEPFMKSKKKMQQQGYKLFGLEVEKKIVTVAGVRVLQTHGKGNVLWVHAMVTKKDHRRKGYGTYMLDFFKEYGAKKECKTIRIYSETSRRMAHKFYKNQGYISFAHLFEKVIKED